LHPARRSSSHRHHRSLSLRRRGRALSILDQLDDLEMPRAHDQAHLVGERNRREQGRAVGRAVDRREPAHGLGHRGEAGTRGVRTVLPETRDAAEHDALVDLAQCRVVDAQPRLDVGPKILDDHVCSLDELAEDLQPFRVFQVERHAALVAMHILEIAAFARAAGSFAFVEAGRHLDLDHLRAPVGELANAGRARAHAGQVDHFDMRKGGGSGHRFESTLAFEEENLT